MVRVPVLLFILSGVLQPCRLDVEDDLGTFSSM